ncbi:MAG: fibronectin type III domain-containing protein [Bacteroidetes bacterium]|nr:fibronectin type III domain-containing protein [Bacteroidota bacterium]
MKKFLLLIVAIISLSAISFSQTVTTNAATNVTQNSATLNGTVNGSGNSMIYIKFEYISDADYLIIGWDGATSVNASPYNNSGQEIDDMDVSASISGLSAGTKYHVRLKAYYSGWYYGSDNSFTTLTPPNSNSDIVSSAYETSNIDYASKTASSISSTTDAIKVWSFTIRDGSGSSDDDTFGTELTSITIDKGTNNSVSNWSNTIRQAALYDGSTEIAEVSVTGETISFTELSGENVTAADNGTKTLDLYLTFETTNITDNQQFQFQIQNSNVTANTSSSTFTTFTAATSSTTSDANRIEVTATKLLFVQQPTEVNIDDTMTPDVTVETTDANNIRDLDFTSNIDITATGATLTTSPLTSAASSGLATFSTISFSSGSASATLNAERNTEGDWDVTSNTFEITQPEMDIHGNGTSIADGDDTPSLTDHTDFGGADFSGTNSVTRTFTIYNLNIDDKNGDLILSGDPIVSITGTNASEFTVTSSPSSSISSTNSSNFLIKFDPEGAGLRTAEINIANNDADENPYNFSIQGIGAVAPTVTTADISSITPSTASSGGNVTSDGGLSVDEKGVCWNTTIDPLYSEAHSHDGEDTGIYSSSIISLTAATKYYVRAYATNLSGTGYGENKSFWTLDTEPTTHPSNFATTNITETSMDFSWDASTGADGYIILQKEGSTPPSSDGVIDGLEKGDFNLPIGTIVTTEIVGELTGNVTNLVSHVTYSFTLIPYSRNLNDSTYNYKTDGSLQTITETTVKGTPTAQANTITFSSIDYTSMTVSWTRGNGDNCVVLAHASAPVDADPVNANEYSPNSAFGTGDEIGTGNYVIYNGSGNSIAITNLNAETTYYYEIFEYNNSDTNIKYLIDGGGSFNPNSRSTLKNAPSTQASNITFSNVDSENLTLNWTRGNGEHCIVVAKQGDGIAPPTDNYDYTANSTFGSGNTTEAGSYVIYNGTGTTVDVANLTQNTDYYFEIFECNNDVPNCKYNKTTASNNPNNQLTLKNTPVNQSSNIAFTNVVATSMTVSWTRPAGGGDHCILVAKQSSAVSNPTNGSSYTPNTVFASGAETATGSYVLYNGNDASPSVDITNLSSTQTYHFKVYEYNNNETSYTKYNLSDETDNPNTETTTTAAPTIQSHDIIFSNIDTTSITASWTNGNGAYRIVVAHEASAVSQIPTDNTHYYGNSIFGSGFDLGDNNYVVYQGSDDNVTVTGLKNYTKYYFQIFDYNDDTNSRYNTDPATNNPNSDTTLKPTPVAQDYNITFDNINATTMTVNWVRPASNGGDNCVLIAKEGDAASNPVNGEDYNASASFGSGDQIGTSASYVVYEGSSSTVNLTNLEANRTYYFKVCEFNNSDGNTKYNTSSTETGNPNSHSTANAAPTTQASGITFSNVDATKLTINWTSGNGQNRIVKMNTSNSFTDPTDGTDPSADNAYGLGEQVVYNSTGSTVNITNLDASTTYWFRAYEYNNSGTSTMYNVSTATDNPDSILTLKNAPTTQATNITFANLASSSVTINWENGNGENRILVAKNGTDISTPTNNTSYSANTIFGSGDVTGAGCYVVYNGSGNTVDVTGLTQNETYEFGVFEFNNSGTSYAKYHNVTATGNPQTLATSGYTQWTGTTSTSWEATENWSSSSVPTSGTDVVIKLATNKPVISSNSLCNNITIEPGAFLTINSGYTLSVSGDLTIEASSSYLGSLIEFGDGSVSVTGSSKIQNYISGTTDWHYLSSPITSTTVDFLTDYYVNSYNESVPSWTHLIAGDALNVMQGYSVKNSSGNATVTFNGTLNTGSKSISTNNSTPTDDSYGWNLVGNPYPSTIDWKAIGWTKSNVDNTVYVYLGNSQYSAYNGTTSAMINGGSRYLSSMQGFFVRASGNGTLGVTNSVRVDKTRAYFKKADELPNNLLKLRVEKGEFNDEAVVLFYQNATQIFDGEFDAYKMFSYNEDIPELYTSTQLGEQLAINTLPNISNNETIPLGFKTEQSGDYTITAVENTFDANTSVLLEDLEKKEVIDLKISDYSFYSNSVYNSDRFLLHIVMEPSFIMKNIEKDNSVSIYSFRNSIYIKNNSQNISKGEVVVYNILGKEIIRKQLNNTTLNKIMINKISGNYIVRVLTNNKIFSEKVFLK